jgi:uncharacterized membrane protein YvlD (DUF360 family)
MIDRAVAVLLLALMVIGSFGLWIGVPSIVLYALGQMTNSSSHHLVLGLIGVPLAMAIFGLFLLQLNALYMRVTRTALVREEEDGLKRVHGPLGAILSTSLVIALIGLVAWLAMFGGQTPQGAGAW